MFHLEFLQLYDDHVRFSVVGAYRHRFGLDPEALGLGNLGRAGVKGTESAGTYFEEAMWCGHFKKIHFLRLAVTK